MLAAFDPLTTDRLCLVPFQDDVVRAVIAGDLSHLHPAEGWPQEGTLNGLSMAVKHGSPAGWMITLDDQVIGDCGTHGPPDADGDIEIGYGLAAPYRGRGYGSELVGAITSWLLAQDDVRAVVANTLADNLASRRVLAKNGFVLIGYDDKGQAMYRRQS